MSPNKPQELDDHGDPKITPAFPINKGDGGGLSASDEHTPSSSGSASVGESSRNTAGETSSSTTGGISSRDLSKLEEQSSSISNKTTADSVESSAINFREEDNSGRFSFSKIRGRFTRRGVAGIAVAGVLGFGGFAGFAVLQGPLQFIHFSQNLQKHFKSNEDFGDDRTSKVLLYALIGKGAENGRLGILSNSVANKWEARLIKETGLRPVYQEGTRRHIGFEIVDEAKAEAFLGNLQDQSSERNAKKLEQSLGNGAEIVDADNVRNQAGTKIGVVRGDGPIDGKSKIISLVNQGFNDRRFWIKTIGKATSSNRVFSAYGSRLLTKRGGVNFHPFNKVKNLTDKEIAKFLDKRSKNISEGTESPTGFRTENRTDADGNEIAPDPEDVKAAGEAKSYIDDFKASGAFKTTANSAVVIGVLCAAKSYGESIEDYKHEKNVVPMMRMGMDAVASGDQARSMDDFNMKTLKVASQFFFDDETNTSASQSESYLAEQGKTGGTPIPEEADLRNATDKPRFFDVLDSVPFLGTACSVQEGFFNLPVIKQVTSVVSSVTTQLTDAALSLGGTSTDELIESSLKVAAGKTVDPNAKGADYGSFANTGVFLAANDAAIASGADALTSAQRAELKNYETYYEELDFEEKSFFARYVNPLESGNLVSSMIDTTPAFSQVANINLSAYFASLGSLTKLVLPLTSAQNIGTYNNYDYGVPKYAFSLDERRDPKFENPYENAQIVEPQLDNLNELYSDCFGMSITADDQGVHLESGEAVNVFKLPENGEGGDCQRPPKSAPQYEMYERYRFYIADSVAVVSLACNEGDQNACSELGTGSGGGATSAGAETSTTPGEVPTGTEVELAKKLLEYKKSGKYNCDNPTDCEDLEFTVQGKSIKGGVGCVADKLDIRVLQMLVFLIDSGYQIGTYALCRSHSYNQGAHPQGRGIDISSINGKSLNSSSSREETLAVDQLIFGLKNNLAPRQIITAGVGATRRVDPEFVKYNRVGPGNEGQSAVSAFGSGTMAGHSDHIHIGY